MRLFTKASMNLTAFSFFNILVDDVGEENCLASVGSVYMFAHVFSVVTKASFKLSGKLLGSERDFLRSLFWV